VPGSFVVVETEDFCRSRADDGTWLGELLGCVKTLVDMVASSRGARIKIMLVSDRQAMRDSRGQLVASELVVHTVEQQVVPVRAKHKLSALPNQRSIWVDLGYRTRQRA